MHPFRSLSYQRQDNDNSRPSKPKSNQGQSNSNSGGSNSNNSNRYASKKSFTDSYYAYGKSAAIEFACDETKKQKINTITLHAASARTDSDRGYDWDNKTIIQLPRHEMLGVVAVLLGQMPRCEYRQSGAHSSKSYKVEFQGAKVFFMVMERGKPIRAVGLTPEDTYHVTALFFRQLKENSPWLSVNEIVQMVEMTIVRMSGQLDTGESVDDFIAQAASEVESTSEASFDDGNEDEDEDEDEAVLDDGIQPLSNENDKPNFSY